jgi:hypothetical protein
MPQYMHAISDGIAPSAVVPPPPRLSYVLRHAAVAFSACKEEYSGSRGGRRVTAELLLHMMCCHAVHAVDPGHDELNHIVWPLNLTTCVQLLRSSCMQCQYDQRSS